jgi:hypothetical protein
VESYLDGEDLEHSKSESRRLRLGKSGSGRVLLIAYTTRSDKNEEKDSRDVKACLRSFCRAILLVSEGKQS